ncbi:hypothetical protein [Poseidonibacter ostreae]|uniref:Uncharacterized protein n=1 Tax=Poseidonibacter ostreae TaxID=2654171 RepID=A0ABQ6VMR2_9BACT|nr:hypothetical protein [Poseidonibacter ostreae]KAB7887500.1 hypothetical protein GA417_02335 [Poseidonibacter ostreae]KAB7891880.1 hypothetical protein GBG18_05440 [Poseidonibacter ostreae]MAC84152.1 hypothetical protein [Arcobacter sp.]
MSNSEIRRLPRRTIVIITVLILAGIAVFTILKTLKQDKMTEILATLGHGNINQIEVINKLSVEDKETRYKSKVYKVRFYDNDINKTCIGFIHMGRYNKNTKDFDCK